MLVRSHRGSCPFRIFRTLFLGVLFATEAVADTPQTPEAAKARGTGDFASVDAGISWVHGHPGREDPAAWSAADGWTVRLASTYSGGRLFAGSVTAIVEGTVVRSDGAWGGSIALSGAAWRGSSVQVGGFRQEVPAALAAASFW